VITILLGRSVNWGKQQRRADGTSWKYAFQQHWKHTLIGIVWGTVLWRTDRTVFWWFLPVLAGMLLAVPFTVFTSRGRAGEIARRAGFFLTPEETEPAPDIILLRSCLAESAVSSDREKEENIQQVILDPCSNALHEALLPDAKDPRLLTALKTLRKDQPEIEKLQEKAIRSGLQSLGRTEKLLLLSEAEVLKRLHRTLWVTPAKGLAKSWTGLFSRLLAR